MKDEKITFQREESRQIGLLEDEVSIQKKQAAWASEDYAKLLQLCHRFGVQNSPSMFYDLALELARKLYPESKKSGRKSKWSPLVKSVLVVEVERLTKPNDPSHGIEWACNQLSKREPWKFFLETKESNLVSPNPGEALRKIYFDSKDEKSSKVAKDAFRYYEHTGEIPEWENFVVDAVKNPVPK